MKWHVFILLILFSSLVVNTGYSSDKPIIAYAYKNGAIGMGTWNIKIEIFKDRKVHYYGIGTGMYVKGDRYSKISKTKLKKLIHDFNSANFLELIIPHYLEIEWHPPLTLERRARMARLNSPIITFNYKDY
jgi:hypothetical protein